ncbi:hypothetical protein LCGC14_0295910 [marine sediment metagenome]|uniref:Uncharacterized protein n=1 Tax=marine sediment metagenome TaxID=412755 RepID=A0A0F9WD72_9ZZZZ|nr:hypothetical protein [Phycisphaerae bacterium]HDZ44178.1 hypothetical protein [Phycisphaerae bacterium]
MIRRGWHIWVLLGGLWLAAAGAPGCMRKIAIDQYPVFWGETEIRSVAVAPFRIISSDDPRAGAIMADNLAAALAINGTYDRVVGRRSLENLLSEEDLSHLTDGAGGVVRRLKELADVDAVIIGTVIQYEATGYSVEYDYAYRRPYYPYYDYHPYYRHYHGGYYGRYWDGPYYDDYITERNDAKVTAAAEILTTETGQTLHVARPLGKRIVSEGSPPARDLDMCLAIAAQGVAAGMVEQFAVTHRVIEVKAKEALRISSGEFVDGQWLEADRFMTAETHMAVVIALPPVADRNHFRLTVSREGADEVLAETTFIWRRDHPATGVTFSFDPSRIAADGGGPGEYTVTFYGIADEPLMTRDFKIVKPE